MHGFDWPGQRQNRVSRSGKSQKLTNAQLGLSIRKRKLYDIINTKVRRCEIVNDRLIVFQFDNGIEMYLEDNSDQYESMQISFAVNPSQWII